MHLKITQISYEDVIFKFNRELEFELELCDYIGYSKKEQVWSITNEEFNIFVFANSKKKVLESLAFWFYASHLNYVLEDDNKLTKKAKIFKNKLKSLYNIN